MPVDQRVMAVDPESDAFGPRVEALRPPVDGAHTSVDGAHTPGRPPSHLGSNALTVRSTAFTRRSEPSVHGFGSLDQHPVRLDPPGAYALIAVAAAGSAVST